MREQERERERRITILTHSHIRILFSSFLKKWKKQKKAIYVVRAKSTKNHVLLFSNKDISLLYSPSFFDEEVCKFLPEQNALIIKKS